MPNLPIAATEGNVDVRTTEQLQQDVETKLIGRVIKGLTNQPVVSSQRPEMDPRDVVFTGSFEEVNRLFYQKEWGDGLPVVPPTIRKVREFLRFTDRSPEEVLGVLLPDKREATVWNIAVNGVMAGCRPEYMPVLVAIVTAMLDPKFGQEHLGNTPGPETLITVNGPIIKELGFNYEQGSLRGGFQANSTVGRFWRLYLRNVAGLLPHKTDKATFGGNWMNVLAENEDAVARINWKPMSVDQGFKESDNVITITTCVATDSLWSFGSNTAEEILDRLAARIVDIQLWGFKLVLHGTTVRPQILLTPLVAELIAKAGYTKEKAKEYLFEHARAPAKRFEQISLTRSSVSYRGGALVRHPRITLCDAVEHGILPEQYCLSHDPERSVPIVWSPEDFMITVTGDPGRDNSMICAQNGHIGFPTSKKIELPANWAKLLKENDSQGS